MITYKKHVFNDKKLNKRFQLLITGMSDFMHKCVKISRQEGLLSLEEYLRDKDSEFGLRNEIIEVGFALIISGVSADIISGVLNKMKNIKYMYDKYESVPALKRKDYREFDYLANSVMISCILGLQAGSNHRDIDMHIRSSLPLYLRPTTFKRDEFLQKNEPVKRMDIGEPANDFERISLLTDCEIQMLLRHLSCPEAVASGEPWVFNLFAGNMNDKCVEILRQDIETFNRVYDRDPDVKAELIANEKANMVKTARRMFPDKFPAETDIKEPSEETCDTGKEAIQTSEANPEELPFRTEFDCIRYLTDSEILTLFNDIPRQNIVAALSNRFFFHPYHPSYGSSFAFDFTGKNHIKRADRLYPSESPFSYWFFDLIAKNLNGYLVEELIKDVRSFETIREENTDLCEDIMMKKISEISDARDRIIRLCRDEFRHIFEYHDKVKDYYPVTPSNEFECFNLLTDKKVQRLLRDHNGVFNFLTLAYISSSNPWFYSLFSRNMSDDDVEILNRDIDMFLNEFKDNPEKRKKLMESDKKYATIRIRGIFPGIFEEYDRTHNIQQEV